MPIPQGAPNSIGTLVYPITQPILGNPGPFLSGSNLYTLCTEVSSAGVTQSLVAYVSSDGDNTLTRIASGIDVVGAATACVFYDQSGGDNVYLGYQDPADSKFKAVVFNMGSGSFGSPSSSGIASTGPSSVGTLWIVNSGSNIWLAWDDVGDNSINATYFNGSSWSSKTTIGSAGTQILPCTAVTGGKAAVWSCDPGMRGNHGSGSIFYTVLNGASVVATSTALTLPNGDNRVGNLFQYSGYYDAASDSSVLPLPMFLHSDFTQFQALLIASPSASPSFSLVTAASGFNDVDFLGWPYLAGNTAGNSFTLIWFRDRDSDGEDLLEIVTSSSLSSGWGPVTLYYDQEANPPTPTPFFDGMFPITANVLSSGELGVVVGMTQRGISPPPVQWCGILYTWPIELTPGCPTIYVARQPQPDAPAPPPPPGIPR